MAVTITDSVGYEGSVEEPDWARLMAYAGGRQYGVVGEGDWKVTAGTADREVRIAPGTGFGSGVLDRTTEAASLTLPAPLSGSRWHLITGHRDWGANESSFDSIAGSTGSAQIPTRETTPGTADDQPLALARVQAGQSQVVEIRDLRVWGGYGGASAVDELVLQYLTQLGTNISIGGVIWRRDLNALGNAVWVRNVPLDVATGSNVIAGNPWDGRSPIRSKFLSGAPQVAADSVTTLTIPDGGFPNGVLHVSAQILSANTAKLCTVASVTKTTVRLQLLNESGGALPAGTAVPLSVRVDGW